MELLAQRDSLEKWSKLISLTDAIERAKALGELVIRSNGRSHRKYDHHGAREIQKLEEQRNALRATMPLKLVS